MRIAVDLHTSYVLLAHQHVNAEKKYTAWCKTKQKQSRALRGASTVGQSTSIWTVVVRRHRVDTIQPVHPDYNRSTGRLRSSFCRNEDHGESPYIFRPPRRPAYKPHEKKTHTHTAWCQRNEKVVTTCRGHTVKSMTTLTNCHAKTVTRAATELHSHNNDVICPSFDRFAPLWGTMVNNDQILVGQKCKNLQLFVCAVGPLVNMVPRNRLKNEETTL